MTLSFQEARATLLRELAAHHPQARTEEVALDEACGRILAAPVLADRDQPPFPRVTRDGFAVRAADLAGAHADRPAALTIVGEVAAGAAFEGTVGPGEAVEIMTGAPLPAGADAVVMVEHTSRAGSTVRIGRTLSAGDNVVPQGSELRVGAPALTPGRRLDPAAIGLLASLGGTRPTVARRPVVAIVSTGDEIVEVDHTPGPTQIRNANRHTLAAQIHRAGGVARPMAIVPDDPIAMRAAFETALKDADLLLVSGGVSAGKYDFVEGVLGQLGARIVFDGVAIRPGKPLVFGWVGRCPFFGLPGNPVSTVVTFELFVATTLAHLSGATPAPLRFLQVALAAPYRQRPLPLHNFVPARLEGEGFGTTARPLSSQGSGDLMTLAGADVLLVVPPGVTELAAGSFVSALPK